MGGAELAVGDSRLAIRSEVRVGGMQFGAGGLRRRWRVALLLALSLVITACGESGSVPATGTSAEDGSFPVTVRGTEIPSLPQRIVSLSATHTEVLYALGAGDRIVATDLFSDYPIAAGETEKVDAFNLSVEAVAALDPDVVILSFDPGDGVSGLTALGIPTLLFAPPGPTDLEAVYDEWRDLALATGLRDEGEALIAETEAAVGDLLALLPLTLRPFSYYLELDPSLFSAGEGTLLSSVMGMLGLVNIAAPEAGAFPQLSAEFIIDADPDFVFLADTVCCGQSLDTVSRRPGWGRLTAVSNGDVIALDDSVASRWGPRLVELMRTVAKEVYGVG